MISGFLTILILGFATISNKEFDIFSINCSSKSSATIRSILLHALKIKHDYAIGIEILHQSLNILEMISKDDNKYKGGRFRLIALNKVV